MNRRRATGLVFLLALLCGSGSGVCQTPASDYRVETYRRSFYKLTGDGGLELKGGLPRQAEGVYRFRRTLKPRKTAVVVMDPWVDIVPKALNERYGVIIESKIMPLVEMALRRRHPVVVLTNDPEKYHYSASIHPKLETLASERKITVLHHQDLSDDQFAAYLCRQGIDTLIYAGFASNMCLIGREMGMIPMANQGFRLFFVPQASAALEGPDTWDKQSVHEAATKIISQWIAEIIDYDVFMMRGARKD